jgi:hypothetical protein
MAHTKKLQNSFNVFLPQKYGVFKRGMQELTSNEAVVAELIRICCEGSDVKAIQMAFERILGKPEKVIVIKRTIVRTLYVDARTKALKPVVEDRVQDETRVSLVKDKVVISADNAPGLLLKKMMDEIGGKEREYSYKVLDDKDRYEVAEVMAANLYGIAMRGSNLGAIKILFDYLDGAVADVVRLEGEDTILLEDYADVAPFEAVQGEDGVFYIETEAVE